MFSTLEHQNTLPLNKLKVTIMILKTVNKIIAYLQAYAEVVSKLHIFINNIFNEIEIFDRKYSLLYFCY